MSKVLMNDKENKKVTFEDDHPATELAEAIEEAGGAITPRKAGFKMTDKDGGKLGFCVPGTENYRVYLTTIKSDNELLEEFDLEVSKGSSGLAVIKDLGNASKTIKTLRKIYKAKAEAEPEPKPKKVKAKDDDDKPKEKKAKKVKDDDDGDEKPTRRRKRKKNKKSDDDE